MSTVRNSLGLTVLLALPWTAAGPAAAQVEVDRNGGVAVPWTERLVLAHPRDDLQVAVGLPPPDAPVPAGGFPVLYYSGTDADALMVEAMRRIGGSSTQALLVGVRAAGAGAVAAQPVSAAQVDRWVRPRIAEHYAGRYPLDLSRDQYFALSPEGRGWSALAEAPARPYQVQVVAFTACEAPDDAAAESLRRLSGTEVLLVSPRGCPDIAGFSDPSEQASPLPRRYHLKLENRDPVTVIPEAMAHAITVRNAVDLEAWRREWISGR